MKFNVNINIDRFETSLRVVDAHTVGGVLSGCH